MLQIAKNVQFRDPGSLDLLREVPCLAVLTDDVDLLPDHHHVDQPEDVLVVELLHDVYLQLDGFGGRGVDPLDGHVAPLGL